MTRYYLAFLALVATMFVSIQAFSQEYTRSHACQDVKDSETLANHLIEHEWVGYFELFETLEAESRCHLALIPVPPPGPPIWFVESDTFQVGIFPLIGEKGAVFGLLLGRYTRASGA